MGAFTRPSPRDGYPGAATGDRVTRGSLRGHRGLRRWFRVHVHAELVALPWDIGPGAQVWAKKIFDRFSNIEPDGMRSRIFDMNR